MRLTDFDVRERHVLIAPPLMRVVAVALRTRSAVSVLKASATFFQFRLVSRKRTKSGSHRVTALRLSSQRRLERDFRLGRSEVQKKIPGQTANFDFFIIVHPRYR